MKAKAGAPVWLFDLDNTLHNASARVFAELNVAMTDYIVSHVQVERAEANRLRALYWHRYGATLLGLERHHGVNAGHFLHHTHALPGLESHVHSHAHDLAALRRLPGRKILLTNAPLAYAQRVLQALNLSHCFERVIAMEQMRMFGQLRPKPDARMFRHVLARLHLQAGQCVLVEDTLVHQKTARRLGMQTVWMQRWLHEGKSGAPATASAAAQPRLRRRPVYVDQRVHSLAELLR
ncbi:pyrimidine 5'-nucleotidase [Paucibacter sp. KCTC 42545]|uniref:pyrimidine 5'-nucleotidase n=1 Tax=Paucibacter sp. KCTC 42545 TaxID=1768242 RepID=UPI000733B4C5|nr:pyrimidine 5'-nucleotidase [Paucibacter sp. KCTC 42545]ALT78116.1 haloacid dehalogenase [Paucibacter sp. KCTC 42545]